MGLSAQAFLPLRGVVNHTGRGLAREKSERREYASPAMSGTGRCGFHFPSLVEYLAMISC